MRALILVWHQCTYSCTQQLRTSAPRTARRTHHNQNYTTARENDCNKLTTHISRPVYSKRPTSAVHPGFAARQRRQQRAPALGLERGRRALHFQTPHDLRKGHALRSTAELGNARQLLLESRASLLIGAAGP